MPFPGPDTFGIVDNPLKFTPFFQNNFDGGMFSIQNFLLLDGTFFMLLDGTHLLLLGS